MPCFSSNGDKGVLQMAYRLWPVLTRNLASQILGEVRDKYRFALVGYVFMPEHVHLLIRESRTASPAKV